MDEPSNSPVEAPRAEATFQDVFGASFSGSGEEELLRVAASFSRQLSGRQMRQLLYIFVIARDSRVPSDVKLTMEAFLDRYMEYKQYNQSREYVRDALSAVSLRKFINSDAFKVNVMKN